MQTVKFTKSEVAELLSFLYIWQDSISEKAKTEKFWYYVNHILSELIIKIGKAKYTTSQFKNIKLSGVEFDAISTLATINNNINTAVINKVILNMPDEVIKINQTYETV